MATFGLLIVLFSSTKAMHFILHSHRRFTLVMHRAMGPFLRNHPYMHTFPASIVSSVLFHTSQIFQNFSINNLFVAQDDVYPRQRMSRRCYQTCGNGFRTASHTSTPDVCMLHSHTGPHGLHIAGGLDKVLTN
jgi:hypothetical protein